MFKTLRLHALAAFSLFSLSASATTWGPDTVLQCPDSSEVLLQPNLSSSSGMSRRLWTDGQDDGPRARFPPVTRCGDKGKIFWVKEAKVLGYLEPNNLANSPSWKNAPQVRFLTETEYYEALAAGLARNPEEELDLRIKAFRAANDARRKDGAGSLPLKAEAQANMEKLLALLSDSSDPGLRLIKGEILRELGRFSKAVKILKAPMEEGYEFDRKFLLKLAQEKDAQLREIPIIE